MLPESSFRQNSRADEAYRLLVDFIEQDGVPVGARLPSELELVERFGLSRTSVRDALARLRSEGRAVSRRGSGSFVINGQKKELVRLSSIESMRDLVDWHEFRLALESEIAALAAERRSETELAEMHRAQERLLAKLDQSFGEHEDAAFHHAIAVGAKNSKLIEAAKALSSHILKWAEVARKFAALTRSERREIITVEHGDILTAIAAGQATEARASMRRHLLNGRARLMSTIQAEPELTGQQQRR